MLISENMLYSFIWIRMEDQANVVEQNNQRPNYRMILPLLVLLITMIMVIIALQQKISFRSKAAEGNSIGPDSNGTYILGEYEPFITPSSNRWDEFTGGSSNAPLFVFGISNLSDIRSWIGHSECPICKPGYPKKQRFMFRNLQIGQIYKLNILPAYSSDESRYFVTIIIGKASLVSSDNIYFQKGGYLTKDNAWAIVFKPETTDLTIELGNSETKGNHYLMFDEIDFIPPAPQPTTSLSVVPVSFERKIKNIDNKNNNGNWYKDNLWTDKGTYNWDEGYIMDAYVSMYIITKNIYWLDKLTSHADGVLSQRTGYVWPEKATGYNWNGFTGAMTFPLSRFARLVYENPSLQPAYKAKVDIYAEATKNAIKYFDKDWRETGDTGYWIYGNEIPHDSLRNQVSAYNMQSLLANSALELSKYYSLKGDIDSKEYFLNKVTRFARYFKSKLNMYGSGLDTYYLWKYSETYDRWEDTGHGNFDILFVYNSYKNNIVFSREDINRFINTLHHIFPDGSLLPSNVIDGSNIPNVSNAIYYWGLLSEFDNKLADKLQVRFERQVRYIRMLDLVVYRLVHPSRDGGN